MVKFPPPLFKAILRNVLFKSAFYAWVLRRQKPALPEALPTAFPGDAKRGQSIQLDKLLETIQSAKNSNDAFDWLSDLQAGNLDTSSQIAREITAEWIASRGYWSSDAWSLDVLSNRICAWIVESDFLLKDAGRAFQHAFATSVTEQSAYLLFALHLKVPMDQGFGIQKAVIFYGLALPGRTKWLQQGIYKLQTAIDAEVFPDGGHTSRNPETHLNALIHLLDIRRALLSRSINPPIWLQASIDKMTPMLRGFLLGDGQLACFNGAAQSDPVRIDAALKASEAKGRAVTNSPHTGFQRLTSRRAILIMDVGAPPNNPTPTMGCAGTLSFELSISKQRLVVNCGVPKSGHQKMMSAFRGTAAHSKLTLADMNSSQISEVGGFGPRVAERVETLRREVDKTTHVEAAHNGYLAPFGLIHKRTLFLSANGNELRGEDMLSGQTGTNASINFHLHPHVQASLVEAGNSVLLKFGKSAGWRFRASNANITLDPSLYFDHGVRRQAQQIVLAADNNGPETIIKWRFAQED